MSLANRLRRIHWLLVPIAAYLAITLVLPALNGAAQREPFARHATIVLAACAVVIAITLSFTALIDASRRKP